MSPSRNEPITTTRIEAFNEAYPEITVDVIGVSNAGHLERARAEAAIGRREADVGESGATVIFQHWEDGLTINYTPPTLLDPNVSWAIFPKVDGPESGVMFSRLLAYFLFVNTRLVPPEERPKSYLELTDAKWKDKCAVRDPSRRGGGNHLFSALRDYHGTDIMRALFENCTVIASGTELARSVARGDHLVSSPVNVGNLVTFQDAPVDLILPEEGGLSILSGGMALYKDPPHPNAAKVWANFWLTKPGQDIFGTETTPFMEEANVGHPLLDPSVPRLPGTPYGNEWAVNQAVNEIDIATTMLEELGKR